MGAGVTTKMKGMSKLRSDMKRAQKRIATSERERAGKLVGRVIQAQARMNLRAQGHIDTGTMIRTIGIAVSKDEVHVGTNAPQAKPMEGPNQSIWTKKPPMAPLLLFFRRRVGLTPQEAKGAYFRWVQKHFPKMIKPDPFLAPAPRQRWGAIKSIIDAVPGRMWK